MNIQLIGGCVGLVLSVIALVFLIINRPKHPTDEMLRRAGSDYPPVGTLGNVKPLRSGSNPPPPPPPTRKPLPPPNPPKLECCQIKCEGDCHGGC